MEAQQEVETLKQTYGKSAIGDIEKMDVDQRQRLLKEAQKKEIEKKGEKVRRFLLFCCFFFCL